MPPQQDKYNITAVFKHAISAPILTNSYQDNTDNEYDHLMNKWQGSIKTSTGLNSIGPQPINHKEIYFNKIIE